MTASEKTALEYLNDPEIVELIELIKNDTGKIITYADLTYIFFNDHHLELGSYDNIISYIKYVLTTQYLGLKLIQLIRDSKNKLTVRYSGGNKEFLLEGWSAEYTWYTAFKFKDAEKDDLYEVRLATLNLICFGNDPIDCYEAEVYFMGQDHSGVSLECKVSEINPQLLKKLLSMELDIK